MLRDADPALDELFDYCDGNLTTKNPDRETITRLLMIAQGLAATVQGDDGEVYTAENLDALLAPPGRGIVVHSGVARVLVGRLALTPFLDQSAPSTPLRLEKRSSFCESCEERHPNKRSAERSRAGNRRRSLRSLPLPSE